MHHPDPPDHDHDHGHEDGHGHGHDHGPTPEPIAGAEDADATPEPIAGAEDADATPGGRAEAEVREILSTVDGQMDSLSTIQAEQDALAATLDERERILVENEQSIAEQRRKLFQWQRELQAAADSGEAPAADDGEADELRARIAELENRIAEKSRAAAASPTEAASAMRVSAMQQRIFRLEEELEAERAKKAEAEAEAESAPTPDPAEAERLADLREKAARIAEVAQHVKRRRERLRLVRRLLRHGGREDRPAAAEAPAAEAPAAQKLTHEDFEQRAAQIRKLELARQELNDKRNELAKREKKMMRRWARSRAVVVSGWLVFVAAIAAGASWVGVDRYVPATVSAMVTLEAKARHRTPLSEGDVQQWREWHVGLLTSDSFRRTLANRMDERRLDNFANDRAVTKVIEKELSVDTAVPKEITLTLAGTDPHEITAVLDILATTVASESQRQAQKREGMTWAEVRGERKEGGRVLYAVVNETPLTDERLVYWGPAFGAVFLVMLMIIGVTYKRLMRVKREFDDDGTLFDPSAALPEQASASSYTIS
ncbi:MAG: hypothetical protein ACYTGP_01850 [Planctomycetota bacterium]|jgi:hypothetical protein